MSLVHVPSGHPGRRDIHEPDFARWCSRMSQEEIRAIEDALNQKIAGDRIHTSSWMPGRDWTGTVYEPIYEKAARGDQSEAARCFGVFVWRAFADHPLEWHFMRSESTEREISGMTYFLAGASS